MVDYGIKYWSNDDFIIEDGLVKVNYQHKPSLLEIVQEIREKAIKVPCLCAFRT